AGRLGAVGVGDGEQPPRLAVPAGEVDRAALLLQSSHLLEQSRGVLHASLVQQAGLAGHDLDSILDADDTCPRDRLNRLRLDELDTALVGSEGNGLAQGMT